MTLTEKLLAARSFLRQAYIDDDLVLFCQDDKWFADADSRMLGELVWSLATKECETPEEAVDDLIKRIEKVLHAQKT